MMDYHTEVACSHRNHRGERICGDVFISRRLPEEDRTLAILSDGMGHGVKASVLATLTATMSLSLAEEHRDPSAIAEIIMRVLPVCSERNMSYSTFTIVDVVNNGEVSILEYDNPLTLVFRGKKMLDLQWNNILLPSSQNHAHRKENLMMCTFVPEKEDRIVFCSDGVTQSGLGTDKFLLGWGRDNYAEYVQEQIIRTPYISAHELSKKVVDKAYANDLFAPKDDTSCGVIYFRRPRKLILCSGPPFDREHDAVFAQKLSLFNGKKIISGATTSSIIATEWNVLVDHNIPTLDPTLPPMSKMSGVDLVTEGVLTLGRALNILRDYNASTKLGKGPADKICEMFLDSDKIYFLIGTCINPNHHSPEMPIKLEARRTLIQHLAEILEHKFLKDISIEYM